MAEKFLTSCRENDSSSAPGGFLNTPTTCSGPQRVKPLPFAGLLTTVFETGSAMKVTQFRNRTCTSEFRTAESTSDGRTIEGYAATFDAPYKVREAGATFVERISPGAFAKSLRERGDKVQCLFNHGNDPAIGKLPVGLWTELTEDSHGLRVFGRLLDTPQAESVRVAIAAGAIDKMSVMFQVVDELWRDRATGERLTEQQLSRALSNSHDGEPTVLRDIKAVRLLECGPVTFPASESTSVGVRAGNKYDISAEAVQARLRLLLELG